MREMGQRKTLLTIDYHTDDETGIYEIGEIDFGIVGHLENYLRSYGRRGKDEIIKALAYLMYAVKCEFRRIEDEKPKQIGGAEAPDAE